MIKINVGLTAVHRHQQRRTRNIS